VIVVGRRGRGDRGCLNDFVEVMKANVETPTYAKSNRVIKGRVVLLSAISICSVLIRYECRLRGSKWSTIIKDYPQLDAEERSSLAVGGQTFLEQLQHAIPRGKKKHIEGPRIHTCAFPCDIFNFDAMKYSSCPTEVSFFRLYHGVDFLQKHFYVTPEVFVATFTPSI